MTSAKFPAAVFKAYDIRGTVPDQLNAKFAFHLGLALGQQARAQNIQKFVIGYDGRHSSPELSVALQQGLMRAGVECIDLGLVPTPLVYFAAHHFDTGSAVAITGSHNPPQYNGFKMMLGGETLYGNSIQQLKDLMMGPLQQSAEPGLERVYDPCPDYLQAVTERVHLARPMRVAIDCGNGATGVIARQLFEALGCEVVMLFEDVDGDFPDHMPALPTPDN